MKLDRVLFRAWLAGCHPQRAFGQFDGHQCPLACFLREALKAPDPVVRNATWNDDHSGHPAVANISPKWATEFVPLVDRFLPAVERVVDETGNGLRITAEDALRLLDGIEETP